MRARVYVAVILSLIVSALIGFRMGAMSRPLIPVTASTAGPSDELPYYKVSHSAIDVMAFVNLLKGFRVGEQTLMMDRLESVF